MNYEEAVINAIVSDLDNEFDDGQEPPLKYSIAYTSYEGERGFIVTVYQYEEDEEEISPEPVAKIKFKVVQ